MSPALVGRHQQRPQILPAVSPAEAELATSYVDEAVKSAMLRAMRLCGSQTKAPTRVAVIGGSTMGSGIALLLSQSGILVDVIEIDDEAVEHTRQSLDRAISVSTRRGRLTAERAERVRTGISVSADLACAALSCFAIEAITEELAAKSALLARLGTILPAGTVIASNTSYLDIDALGAAFGRPDALVGLHFFSPAASNRLVEIARGRQTSEDTVRRAAALALRLGKCPLQVKNVPGFVANLMMQARSAQIEHLLLVGASPAEIDRAHVTFGWKMGPLAAADLAGLDISWRYRLANHLSAPIADLLCAHGRFGQKSGLGYFRYDRGSTSPLEDPDVDALIRGEAARRSLSPLPLSDDEIGHATLRALSVAGDAALDADLVEQGSDIDVIWTQGFGFPVWRGGPIYAARHADAA